MAEVNDDFFLEDQEAIEAAERLHSLGTSSPAVLLSASASARRFRVEHKYLKDAVLAATLKGKIKEADELHFAVGDGLIEIYAQFKGVEIWVVVRKEGSQSHVEQPLNFNLPHTTAQRLVALKGIGTFDAQILLGGGDHDADELRVKLGNTRVRLRAAQARPIPADRGDISGGTHVSFDPSALKMALRDNLGILEAASASKAIVSAANTQVYAGNPKALVVSTHPSFSGIDFQIAVDDARVLARVVGRMLNGRATFSAYESHYVFRDDLILCRVRRTSGGEIPIANILAAKAERTIIPLSSEVNKVSAFAALVNPERISLEWPDRSARSDDAGVKLALHADTLGRDDDCHSVINGWADPSSVWSSSRIILDARLWMAAARLFDLDAQIQWQTLKNGDILKLTGAKDDAQTIVLLAAIRD
jgi:hypothetical protein